MVFQIAAHKIIVNLACVQEKAVNYMQSVDGYFGYLYSGKT